LEDDFEETARIKLLLYHGRSMAYAIVGKNGNP